MPETQSCTCSIGPVEGWGDPGVGTGAHHTWPPWPLLPVPSPFWSLVAPPCHLRRSGAFSLRDANTLQATSSLAELADPQQWHTRGGPETLRPTTSRAGRAPHILVPNATFCGGGNQDPAPLWPGETRLAL